jgi:cold shock CspA family protein
MRTKSFLVALMMAALAMPAFAQAPAGAPGGAPPPATNVRGKIVKLDGKNVTVKTREGQTVNVALTADAGVRYMKKSKLSDIKQGDYLSILTVQGKDGKPHAVDIHGLPARAPENQIPFDYAPGSMMTNAHVQGIAKAKNGNVLTVTQKGTSSDVIIDRKTVIDAGVEGAMTDLKPGKAVFIRANKGADGSLTANNITVEKNGFKPVM